MHFHACNGMRQHIYRAPCETLCARSKIANEKNKPDTQFTSLYGKKFQTKAKEKLHRKNTFEALSACDRMCYTFNEIWKRKLASFKWCIVPSTDGVSGVHL